MGMMVTRLKLQSNKRCEVCHKPTKEGYRINIDGYNIFVCSGRDAELARKRWEEKKKLGITPQHPEGIKEEPEEVLGENIPENEGD
jgi:hypothetical protein